MFITIEGCEGAGKSSVIHYIQDFCIEHGKTCITTREPGGTQFGVTLRGLLLNPQDISIPPFTELFLYLADRNYHVHNIIKPALEKGHVVICDRFTDSTIAYQGYARGLPIDVIKELNNIATESLTPDYTFFLDVDPQKGLERAKKRSLSNKTSQEESRFENEALTFHIALSQAYKKLAQEDTRFITIDANKDFEDVVHDIQKHLITIFP